MVSASRTARTAHTIESTAESLQGERDRLELQKRSLERELAAVADHLDTVRRAVHALESVMTDQADAPPAAQPTVAPRPSPTASTRPPTREKNPHKTAGKATGKKPKSLVSEADAPSRATHGADRTYGRLTEQILAYLAQAGDTDVRARDVAAALGRATDSGSINAIRSTLDRLVGASRIQRTGRGLYRSRPS
ncbi:hypothetical protein [Streptomyces sp. NPDC048295]|uniref:hypothetical protein n=1 Tax=Streptomyces sp. NPDC048295 TaxID=3154617 RepID=UPI0034443F98